MIRTLAIWIFGLIAAATIGGFIGSAYDDALNSDAVGLGFPSGALVGMCAFICLRLWIARRSQK
jgi:hypothetical protein